MAAEAFKEQVLKLGKEFREKKTTTEKLQPVKHREQSQEFQESTINLRESEKIENQEKLGTV